MNLLAVPVFSSYNKNKKLKKTNAHGKKRFNRDTDTIGSSPLRLPHKLSNMDPRPSFE